MRHSSLSFAFAGLISAAMGACVASGDGESVHGPDFGAGDAGDAFAAPDTRGPDEASDAAPEASGGNDAGEDAAQHPDANGTDAGQDASPVDSGGCGDTTAVVAGNGTTLFEALEVGRGAWSIGSTGAPVLSAPAIVSTGGAGFHAVIRSSGDALKWTSTAGATWSVPVALGAAITKNAPALAALGANLHLIYLGTDGKYYHGTYAANAWDAASDKVGGATQSFGPTPVSVAAVGNSLLFSHRGGTSSQLYAEGWSAGTWSSAPVASAQVELLATSTIAMNGGAADAMIAYVHAADFRVTYATRTGATWAGPNQIDATLYVNTSGSVSVAPVAGGKAVLVFRGTDNKAYAIAYDGAAWSAAMGPLAPGALAGAPAIAPGACGDDAVAVLPMAGAEVQVVRLAGGAWSAPVALTGTSGATSAAIATGK